ncbi:MAG TPA: protoglobin domain-containing protein [Pirellulales bacterium]|jgi:signal transduction histidine kinase|nr:protoglobin domain-containing protein [Pirellulales bacterium]
MTASNDPRPPDEAAAADSAERLDPLRRLAFLEMTEADAARLQGMAADFQGWADEMVEVFYRHLFAFEETAKFLKSPPIVKRLKQVQREHFESMLEADWNEVYFQQRLQVGHVHAEIGIEPQYFLGAFNQYVKHSLQKLAERQPHDVEAFKDQASSLMKAVFLDIGLTLDAYFAQSTLKLRHALDIYWQANAELRQFAQLTSHDLKTPLATVANLCDEALDEFGRQIPDAAKRLIEAAKDRTFRMSRMIDELLASTLPGDHEPPSTVSGQEALEEAIETTRPLLEENAVEVCVLKPLPLLRGNRARLREAFANLLSNAAKFIDRRPGRVTIDVQNHGGQCLIIFADDGPGIPPDELDRLFVPFRRLAMHRSRPGSGLGLYFTKNLIMQQGGRIWVESKLGEGSRFHIQLPLSQSPARDPAPADER